MEMEHFDFCHFQQEEIDRGSLSWAESWSCLPKHNYKRTWTKEQFTEAEPRWETRVDFQVLVSLHSRNVGAA